MKVKVKKKVNIYEMCGVIFEKYRDLKNFVQILHSKNKKKKQGILIILLLYISFEKSFF